MKTSTFDNYQMLILLPQVTSIKSLDCKDRRKAMLQNVAHHTRYGKINSNPA